MGWKFAGPGVVRVAFPMSLACEVVDVPMDAVAFDTSISMLELLTGSSQWQP